MVPGTGSTVLRRQSPDTGAQWSMMPCAAAAFFSAAKAPTARCSTIHGFTRIEGGGGGVAAGSHHGPRRAADIRSRSMKKKVSWCFSVALPKATFR